MTKDSVLCQTVNKLTNIKEGGIVMQALTAGQISELQTLRNALENAKNLVRKQSDELEKLKSPPFKYATVVALSAWRESEVQTANEYLDTTGQKIGVNTMTKRFSKYHLGDRLRFIGKPGSRVIDEIVSARELVIVGFTVSKRIVVQIDGGVVIADSDEVISSIFEIIEEGRVGMIQTAVIVSEGSFYEVKVPEGCTITSGDTVLISNETMQIIESASVQVGGEIAYVKEIVNSEFVVIDYMSSTKVVFTGAYSESIEKGDRVVLDPFAVVVVSNLGKDDDRFKVSLDTGVTWDDIKGLDNAKVQMIEAIEMPYKNPEMLAAYKKKPVKGVLLFGPPGCGKTMLGKATAASLAGMNSEKARDSGFIYIKGPEILDRYVGVAEAIVRQIFQKARAHKKEFGFPAVIFIDEAEALLSKRGSGVSSDVEKTIVPMFCNEMDGLEDSGAIVILATNREDILDPAIIRDGRIDRKIKIDRPTRESAFSIMLRGLDGVPLYNGATHSEIAKYTCDEVFNSSRVISFSRGDGSTVDLMLSQLINGAMIAGIVEKAISFAISRDIRDGAKKGVKKEDMLLAIDMVVDQNRQIDHSDEVAEIYGRDYFPGNQSVRRLIQST